MKTSLETARELLKNTKTLPVISSNAQSIFSKASDQFIGLKTLASCIETEPVISARIVGLANSSFYGQVNEITSVESAIIRVLGLDLTRGIVIGMICSGILKTSTVSSFNTERFWKSSIRRSVVASAIASKSSLLTEQVPLCSLAGMLSSIGLLAATVVAPNETQASLNTNKQSFAKEMNSRLGCNFRHMTVALAELWTLPSEIQETFYKRCEINWMSDECLEQYTPIQACISLVDILKEMANAQPVQETPTIKKLLNILRLSHSLSSILESINTLEADEIAMAMTKI